jgi:hypothetical protein
MRTAILSALLLGLLTSPALALSGGGPGNGKPKDKNTVTLVVDNACDGAVSVTGSTNVNSIIGFGTLEPGESRSYALSTGGLDQLTVTLTATLVSSPSISATNSATLKVRRKATATITCPTPSSLAITFSGTGLVARFRESGVMLASSGGLMSLLWLSFLLGRAPRRRASPSGGVQQAW